MSPRTERMVAMQNRNFRRDVPAHLPSGLDYDTGYINHDLLPPIQSLEAFRDDNYEDVDMKR
jgi:hypothetical protein